MDSSRAFRDALAQFATGVAVITAEGPDGIAVGMTMNSFNSVSMDPPLVLFSVDRRARSLPALIAAKGFGINILSREQEQLSNRFARALTDKWEGVPFETGHGNAPLLKGVLAQFECAPYARYPGGDHEIFVVRVLRHAVAEAAEPLLFFQGRYRDIGIQQADLAHR